MFTVLMPNPKQQFFDNNGLPLVGGQVFTYAAGTNNPKATYTDEAGTTPQTNPVILNIRGEPANAIRWIGAYKVVVQDALGNIIYTVDDFQTPASADALASVDGAGMIGFNYATVYPLATLGRWLTDLALGAGSSFIGFLQAGVGAAKRPVQDVLREQHSVWDFYLAGEATAEGMINRAITAHNRAHLTAGIYSIDTDVGIKLRTGTVLTGDGRNKTILSAVLGKGGSIAELASYSKGSVIKRTFLPGGPNDYVNDIYIADIGIVLNHPAAAITTSAIQIGFDMRNVSTATIERCHVGNIAPVGGPLVKAYDKPFAVQGYGVVFGNVSGSDPAYAGGEKNRFQNSSVYGAYKCVIQDDVQLSGSSASYATIVRDNDIQTGHWLIGQMGQYGAGNVHTDNILQDIIKQSGSVATSYIQYYDGYNNYVRPTYIEGGNDVDYQLYLDTDTNNNRVDMMMAGVVSGAGLITDASNPNSFNLIRYYGLAGTGAEIELYNKAPRRAWVKFHWDGAAIVIDGSSGVTSVTRTGVGDYLVTWSTAFPTDDYNLSVTGDTNTSGHIFGSDVFSHSTTNTRVYTYAQNAGVSTIIDPRFVWVGANQ